MRIRLGLVLSVAASLWCGATAAAEMTVTLLGTGTPTPRLGSFSPTQTTYKGPLIVGRDLMSFVISDKVEAFAANGDALKPLVAGP